MRNSPGVTTMGAVSDFVAAQGRLFGYFHDFIDNISEKLEFHVNPIVVNDVFKTAMAVVTGSNDHFGTLCLGGKELFGLYLGAFHPGILNGGPQLITPPPAPQQ